jgi:hypothetical protein
MQVILYIPWITLRKTKVQYTWVKENRCERGFGCVMLEALFYCCSIVGSILISVAAATIGESVSTNLTAEQGITSFAKPC